MVWSLRYRDKVLPLAAVFAVLTIQTPLAGAQDLDAPETLSLYASFDHYMRRYVQAASNGDTETANRVLEDIKRLRVERNAFALNDVGISFVYQGLAYLEASQIDEARTHFEIARELSPDLPTAYWGLARVDEEQGTLGHFTGSFHRALAQAAALRSARDGPYAAWNVLFLLLAALMLVFFVYAVLMLYRYGALLYHDFEERFGDRLGGKGVLAATFLVLFLPIILTAGVGWMASYWMALTFGYQSLKERLVSVTSLLALLAVAPTIDVYAKWARTVTNPVYEAALSSVTGTFDVADVLVLREAARQSPQDRDLQFLLATQEKNLGDYELAARQYRRILELFPGDLEAQLNLGNIYFAQRDWDGALVQYNEVLSENPELAMAYYNKSLAHAESFQFQEREEARARAEGLDAAAVAEHERRTGTYRVVADARLDERDILAKFYGLSQGMREQPVETFVDASFLEGPGLDFAVVPVALGVLIVLLEVFFKDRKLTKRCWKCASAFCGRCQIGTGRRGLCTQCYHLFSMKDGVSAQARNEKLAQVQRVSKKRSLVFRLLSIAAPGSGHIGEGMPLVGTTLLFVWFLGVRAFIGRPLYALPDGLLGMGGTPPTALAAFLVVVFVLANLISRPVARG